MFLLVSYHTELLSSYRPVPAKFRQLQLMAASRVKSDMESMFADPMWGRASQRLDPPRLQTSPSPSVLNELVQLYEQLAAEGFERLVTARERREQLVKNRPESRCSAVFASLIL